MFSNLQFDLPFPYDECLVSIGKHFTLRCEDFLQVTLQENDLVGIIKWQILQQCGDDFNRLTARMRQPRNIPSRQLSHGLKLKITSWVIRVGMAEFIGYDRHSSSAS